VASGQALDMAVRRRVSTSERPFQVVPDGIYDGISQPDIGALFAKLAASISYEESFLLTHPRVAESAVPAAPGEVRGEVIHAFVVATAPVDPDDTDLTRELQDWVREKYAAHAYPRHITFIDALPKTPSGKVQRAVLRRRFLDGAPQVRPSTRSRSARPTGSSSQANICASRSAAATTPVFCPRRRRRGVRRCRRKHLRRLDRAFLIDGHAPGALEAPRA
jgi:hypothetical protein